MISTSKPASTPQDKDLEVPSHFRVHDRQTANWVVRKIVEARAYGEQIEEWAEAERRRARREEDFFLRRFQPDLYAWLTAELAERGGKAKSFNLPAGRIGLRHCGPKIEVLDQQAVLAWARVNCRDAVKRTESVLKTPLKDHFEATGELPDGVTLHHECDVFYIK